MGCCHDPVLGDDGSTAEVSEVVSVQKPERHEPRVRVSRRDRAPDDLGEFLFDFGYAARGFVWNVEVD